VVLVLYCASVSASASGGARKGLEAADRAVAHLRARLSAFAATAFLRWAFGGAAKPYFETALVLLWAFCGECCSSRQRYLPATVGRSRATHRSYAPGFLCAPVTIGLDRLGTNRGSEGQRFFAAKLL
jgi:hypothetical protein